MPSANSIPDLWSNGTRRKGFGSLIQLLSGDPYKQELESQRTQTGEENLENKQEKQLDTDAKFSALYGENKKPLETEVVSMKGKGLWPARNGQPMEGPFTPSGLYTSGAEKFVQDTQSEHKIEDLKEPNPYQSMEYNVGLQRLAKEKREQDFREVTNRASMIKSALDQANKDFKYWSQIGDKDKATEAQARQSKWSKRYDELTDQQFKLMNIPDQPNPTPIPTSASGNWWNKLFGNGNTENPYKNDYPDSFFEKGQWKVVRNGKKFILQD